MTRLTFSIVLLSCLMLAATSASAVAATPRIDARQAHQRARIAAGVADGELTRREARQLQTQQRHIRYSERRAKSDGVVTVAERRHLQQALDRSSRAIRRHTRDACTR